MPALPECVDAVVIGGGPAGAALAGLLAARGFSCALIDDSKPRRAARLETLLPSAMEALQRCGLDEVVRNLSEPDERRHASRWDSDEWVYRDEARAGRCIDRSTFDVQLREWARTRGAHVVEDATARVIDAEAGVVEVVRATDVRRLQAKAIAIAAGRVAKLDATRGRGSWRRRETTRCAAAKRRLEAAQSQREASPEPSPEAPRSPFGRFR
jgi:2-polyprenyl-6-methoxyphenol hydroxylase-like FAD-dependent oxidoreductase